MEEVVAAATLRTNLYRKMVFILTIQGTMEPQTMTEIMKVKEKNFIISSIMILLTQNLIRVIIKMPLILIIQKPQQE